jgi:BarA-like signal transduction histidine kinase
MKKIVLLASLLISFAFTQANIVLKNFQAVSTAAGARIVWEFSSEERDVTCHLEKSTDGINFVVFRTMQISSTRQQALHSYIDRGASGQTFYRLRITKLSYTPFISPIVSLNVLHAAGSMRDPVIVGLPAHSFFGDLAMKSDVVSVRLVDLRGQSKIKQFVKGTDLERVFRPSFSSLPSGYYVLSINNLQNKPLMTKCIYKL